MAIQQIVQLGMFSIITYAVELLLEYGFMKMIGTIVMQIIQGGWAVGWVGDCLVEWAGGWVVAC